MKKLFSLLGIFILSSSLFAVDSEILDAINAKLVKVDGGTFMMGSEGNENNETPVHEVSVQGFYMLSTEVTQAEYKAVIDHNFSNNKGDSLPVEETSWYDAVIFCNKLSIASELVPCYSLNGSSNPDEWGEIPRMNSSEQDKAAWNSIKCDFNASGYRLPTEEEWEYAATAQGKTNFLYSGSDNINIVAWNVSNSDDATHEVAKKIPNALGLYDMSGNVWEWCQNWYGSYKKPIAGDSSLGRKMRRGGSIKSEAVFARNANRASSVPELRGVDLGFRIVKKAENSVYELEKPYSSQVDASLDSSEKSSKVDTSSAK